MKELCAGLATIISGGLTLEVKTDLYIFFWFMHKLFGKELFHSLNSLD